MINMKALCLKDINSYENLINKLFSHVDSLNPDIIICLGGLFQEKQFSTRTEIITAFPESESLFGVKPKSSLKNREINSVIDQTVVLEQLAIFGLPVLLIPCKDDLKSKFAIKRAKNTENILFRWLDGKITSIEGFVFLGLSNNSQVSKYINSGMFDSNMILCSTDDPILLEQLMIDNKSLRPKFLITTDKFNSISLPNITCCCLKSLKEEIMYLMDFDNDTFKEIQI